MGSTTERNDYAKQLALYEKVVQTLSNVERKGATMPYTSVNGHMFSFLAKDGVVALRLSEDELTDFIKKYKTEQAVQHGRVMNEYVVVPSALLQKTKELSLHFKASFNYVSSLKPKATKKLKSK